jgi:hypothetical protein
MTPAILLARLTSRGYIPVSHAAAGYPGDWLGPGGRAGRVRVVTHPGDGGQIEVYGLGPEPAGPPFFEIRVSARAPETVTVAMLNAAEAWLAEPAAAGDPATPALYPRPLRPGGMP